MEVLLSCSYFAKARDTHAAWGVHDIVDQDGTAHPGMLEDLTQRAWRKVKSDTLDAIGCYRLKPGTRRSTANVQHVTALILDIDQTAVDFRTTFWGDIPPHAELATHRAFVMTSPTNGWRKTDDDGMVPDPACHSWKVIYPLQGKMRAETLTQLQRAIYVLSAGSDCETDRSTSNPDRICYRGQAKAPGFWVAAVNDDSPELGKDAVLAIIAAAKELDPEFVVGGASKGPAIPGANPQLFIEEIVPRKRGGNWRMLSGGCPFWDEDGDETTLAEFYQAFSDALDLGEAPDKTRGTLFGGSTRRCMVNMAGGMLTISDMKRGTHYGYRPPPDKQTQLDVRTLPRTGRLDHTVAAADMADAYAGVLVVDRAGVPFMLDPDTNTWEADMDRVRLRAMTKGFSGRLTKRGKNGDWNSPFSWNRRWGTEAASTLCDDLQDDPMIPWDGGIAFQDGLLMLDGEFRARTPDDYVRATDVLPYDYAAGAECPRWLDFLDEVLLVPLREQGRAAINIVQMYIGACLAGKAHHCNRMVLLTGGGANGKSVMLNVLRSLFAPSGVSTSPPGEWGKPEYLVRLYNSRVNIVNDVGSASWRETGVIKRVLGGEMVTVKHLYKNPFDCSITCGHWFALNALPSVWDDSLGWRRRSVVVPFARTFRPKEQDPFLLDALLKELPGIALWALEGLRRIEERGWKLPNLYTEVEQEWSKSNESSVMSFAGDYMIPIHDDKEGVLCTPKDLYPYYRAYCRRVGEKPHSQRSFGYHLSRFVPAIDVRYEMTKNKTKAYRILSIDPTMLDLTKDFF